MKVHNNTELAEAYVYGLPVIKAGKNHWRGRDITLRQHPTDPDRVISVGTTFDREVRIIADEPKSAWTRELSAFGDFETF